MPVNQRQPKESARSSSRPDSRNAHVNELSEADIAQIVEGLSKVSPAPVVATTPVKEEATWGLNRPFRSWEAMASCLGILVLMGTPLMSIRDTLNTVAANYARREDVVARKDFEVLQSKVETQQQQIVLFNQIKEQRTVELDGIHRHQADQDAQISAIKENGTRIEGKLDTLTAALANASAKE